MGHPPVSVHLRVPDNRRKVLARRTGRRLEWERLEWERRREWLMGTRHPVTVRRTGRLFTRHHSTRRLFTRRHLGTRRQAQALV
jgi:hypothetical protein